MDFDHQFLEAEKYDSKRTYKGFDGYSPGVFTIAVPAKWVRTARQYKLNIYSAKPYNIIWEHG